MKENGVQILVNSVPFDVTIEDEQTIGEVVAGISGWLKNNEYSITGIEIDGKRADLLDKESWKDISIHSSKTINLVASSFLEQRNEHLTILLDYIIMFKQALASANLEVVRQLLAEYGPVRGSVDPLINPGESGEPLAARFDQLLAASGLALGKPGPQALALIDFFRNLEILIRDRLDEVQNPRKELDNAVAALREIVPVLEDLPILLQTGKDSEAMQQIVTFTELYGKLTRLFPYLKACCDIDLLGEGDSPQIGTLYQELNPILAELTDAFDSSDAVLIGDLVEYEIAPRISTLCTEIESALKESEAG